MGKIVYHGTLSNEAPHEHGFPFHAGTLRAANDRIDDEISHGTDWDSVDRVGISLHAYEINDDAPMSRKVWDDPMFAENEENAVPEHKENRIYRYRNAIEDRGAVSYVIPSSFVGKHVKHLGVQFEKFIDGTP